MTDVNFDAIYSSIDFGKAKDELKSDNLRVFPKDGRTFFLPIYIEGQGSPVQSVDTFYYGQKIQKTDFWGLLLDADDMSSSPKNHNETVVSFIVPKSVAKSLLDNLDPASEMGYTYTVVTADGAVQPGTIFFITREKGKPVRYSVSPVPDGSPLHKKYIKTIPATLQLPDRSLEEDAKDFSEAQVQRQENIEGDGSEDPF